MDYPETLTFKQLSSRDEDYEPRQKFTATIKTLYQGGRHIEACKQQFLTKRLDEDSEIYKIRLERFTYTNVLASLLTRIMGRFSTGEIFLAGTSDSFSDAWSAFREATDADECDEQLFLARLLKHLILYQDCHVQVDKPLSAFRPLNRAEEEEFGLNKANVIIYGPDELLTSGPGWFKFLTLEAIAQPFSEPVHLATWRFIDDEAIAEYSSRVELNDGKIVALVRDGKRIPVADDLEILLTKWTVHGFDRLPVISVCLPDEQYAAGQVYLKLKQHIGVENALTDSALTSGYVQRVLTPQSTKEDDYDVIDPESFRSDNAHVIKAASFKFEEISGSSIKTNSDLLEKIEGQIERLVCITGGSISKGALVQSGESKAMDTHDFELFLRAYGRIITAFYQDILQLVAQALGDTAADVNVTGLDSFDLDSLEDGIDKAIALIPIQSNMAPAALTNLYIKISQGLSPNASAEERELIAGQVPTDFTPKELPVSSLNTEQKPPSSNGKPTKEATK